MDQSVIPCGIPLRLYIDAKAPLDDNSSKSPDGVGQAVEQHLRALAPKLLPEPPRTTPESKLYQAIKAVYQGDTYCKLIRSGTDGFRIMLRERMEQRGVDEATTHTATEAILAVSKMLDHGISCESDSPGEAEVRRQRHSAVALHRCLMYS